MEQLGWMLVEVKHGEKEMFVLEAEDGRRLCCGEDQMASGCAAARLSPR